MSNNLKKYLDNILFSIGAIEIHTKDIYSFNDYESNTTATDAEERRLAIIGEAMHKPDKSDKAIPISHKSKIISLRHILVHEYDLIEEATIWNIIFNHLPALKVKVQTILNSNT